MHNLTQDPIRSYQILYKIVTIIKSSLPVCHFCVWFYTNVWLFKKTAIQNARWLFINLTLQYISSQRGDYKTQVAISKNLY